MRLGFPVRVLGRRGLRAYDTRRPQNAPHLSVSLVHLRDVFAYLQSIDVRFYRLSSDLAPFNTHPQLPQFHHQIEACEEDLAAIGALAEQQGLRLTIHAPLHVQLAAEDGQLAAQGIETLRALAALLDAMNLDGDAVIVVHLGGLYGAEDASIGRWVARWDRLPPAVQRRIVLEHDDAGPSLGMVLRVHAATGVPLVFDHLHFCLNNPERWSVAEGIAVALATWPHDRTPKLHFSSPRTELRVVERAEPNGAQRRWLLSPPRPGHHADFLNPWEFAGCVRAAAGVRAFDVMLEAKASDLALLRLRHDLARYAPDVAAWFACEGANVNT
jgi:UV DNA damage endonuclease